MRDAACMKIIEHIEDTFEHVAAKVAIATGSFWAFGFALLSVMVWAAFGPPFDFSETWQLLINTATTIITFLMVFVIQHAQNKDTRAMQLKLNELIAAVEKASNRLIDIEDLGDKELEHLHQHYQRLAAKAARLEHATHGGVGQNKPSMPPSVGSPSAEEDG
jgi:low affinity Fe/Cu permease